MGFGGDGVAQMMLRLTNPHNDFINPEEVWKKSTGLGFPGLWSLRAGNWNQQKKKSVLQRDYIRYEDDPKKINKLWNFQRHLYVNI